MNQKPQNSDKQGKDEGLSQGNKSKSDIVKEAKQVLKDAKKK